VRAQEAVHRLERAGWHPLLAACDSLVTSATPSLNVGEVARHELPPHRVGVAEGEERLARAAEAEHTRRGQAAHHPGQRVRGQARELPVAANGRARQLAQHAARSFLPE
jgi:hypothetical protein